MRDYAEAAIVVLLCLCGCLSAVFAFGYSFGRERQCETLGAEYQKGKCVLVDRKELKL